MASATNPLSAQQQRKQTADKINCRNKSDCPSDISYIRDAEIRADRTSHKSPCPDTDIVDSGIDRHRHRCTLGSIPDNLGLESQVKAVDGESPENTQEDCRYLTVCRRPFPSGATLTARGVTIDQNMAWEHATPILEIISML